MFQPLMVSDIMPGSLPESFDAIAIDRTVFLPGATTDGHYQIEIQCNECHTDNFADVSSLQDACTGCHAAELKLADDSHPRTKFTDPRNADRVEMLDARWCVTCHQEHRPEVTQTMGLSLPGDYCYRCHENVGEDRPTHEGLAFDSCSNSGCHNFHDNKALYEDFLVEHRDEPDIKSTAWVRLRQPQAVDEKSALGRADHDAPGATPDLEKWVAEWAGTQHAEGGVNCSDCHAPDDAEWSDAPALATCESCHEGESEGFLAGRHGMRLAAGLSAMTPSQARLPMQPESADHALDCNQCHSAHAYDTREAAVEACLTCHADDHSLAYEASPHAELWRSEESGEGPPGSGVSCATCHLPRIADARDSESTHVAHNQNDFLRPNDKMIRSSCLHCHGLGFSIDALADPALITNNFVGRPAREVESIHYAAKLRWELEGRDPPWSAANSNSTEKEPK